jgi:hypothetical protein
MHRKIDNIIFEDPASFPKRKRYALEFRKEAGSYENIVVYFSVYGASRTASRYVRRDVHGL